MTRPPLALSATLAALLLAGCGVNAVPTEEEAAKAEWADVQSAYQRRANLIPNLVATVKGAATAEERTLTNVTQARANATRIQLTGEQLRDPQAMQRFAEAQNQLSAAILPLQRMQEAYPQLQSQQNFATLMHQLEGTENRISVEIDDYNRAVQNYNTTIRTFPNAIGAKVFYGAKPMVPFQATVANAEVAPQVQF